MGRFFIDKQSDGWRWYSYAGMAVSEETRGFRTRGDALAHAQARFSERREG